MVSARIRRQRRRRRLRPELAKASGSAILAAMQSLDGNWKTGSWLGSRNPYRENCVRQIKRDSRPGRRLSQIALAEYVAASAIVHCFDGWSYLARALEAEMAGDPDSARHLGYYAELRAGMSTLASGGIGAFDHQHIVVSGPTTCELLEDFGGTHTFVWDALDLWANSNAGRNAVLGAIKPGGLPLADWLSQFSSGTHSLTTNWLRGWGLDLSRLAADRAARNVASYRPTAFTTPGPRPVKEAMEGVLRFWEVCDPGANGGFPVLDSHLLRGSLRFLSESLRTPGRNIDIVKRMYRQNLDAMLNSVTPRSNPGETWLEFLSFDKLVDTPRIISDANESDDVHHKDHSKQVLARATLLLRVATGCAENLLSAAGPSVQSDLEFWRSDSSVRRRLWPNSQPPSNSIDLWADVEDASTSVDQWLNRKGPSASHHGLWVDQAAAAATLATAERAFLWGVGL